MQEKHKRTEGYKQKNKNVAEHCVLHKKTQDYAQAGITLVALVVTIIVLLVLAGITLKLVLGENGIISRAGESSYAQEKAIIEQEIELAKGYGETYRQTGTGDYFEKIAEYLNASETLKKIGETIAVTKGNYVDLKIGQYRYKISEDSNTESNLKVGDTNISTIDDLSEMYGKRVNYVSTSHPRITWDLLYADEDNYYIIASSYVENSELPCNGLSFGEQTYGDCDLQKCTGTTYPESSYYARFTSSSEYNDFVMTSSKHSTGIESAAISQNPISSTYLKWINSEVVNAKNNVNMIAVAYMMDTEKWSSFADGADVCYAIGGPTIELFTLSYNATHSVKLGTYEVVDSTNSGENGYKINKNNGAWGDNVYALDSDKTENHNKGNMYVIADDSFSGYFLASPSNSNSNSLIGVSYSYWNKGYLRPVDCSTKFSFRPVVCIPRTSSLLADRSFSLETLRKNDTIIYQSGSGSNIECKVLYPSTSQYGFQVLADDVVGRSLKVTNDYQGYNDAIAAMNRIAKESINLDLSPENGARCFGSDPSISPIYNESNGETFSYDEAWFRSQNNKWYTTKYCDTDWKEAGSSLLKCSNKYWLAARKSSLESYKSYSGGSVEQYDPSPKFVISFIGAR